MLALHGKAKLLQLLIANIFAALQQVRAAAAQFKTTGRWAVLLRDVSDKIAPNLGPFKPQPWLGDKSFKCTFSWRKGRGGVASTIGRGFE